MNNSKIHTLEKLLLTILDTLHRRKLFSCTMFGFPSVTDCDLCIGTPNWKTHAPVMESASSECRMRKSINYNNRGRTSVWFYAQGGPVKLDSMWQYRLTRPLHVQPLYSIRISITVQFTNEIHLTLFQEGCKVAPRRIFGLK